MIKFEYNGARCYVSSFSREEMKILSKTLTYTDQDAVQANRFSKGNYRQPEQVCCFDNKSQSFPTGLLGRVLSKLDFSQIPYQIHSHIEPVAFDEIGLPDWAYSHQKELVRDALDSIRCIGSSPTGSGKTKSMVFFTNFFMDSPILIICPRTGILKNTKKELENYLGETIGEYSGKTKKLNRVTVATINSLYRNLEVLKEYLASIRVMIIDECHNVTQGMYLTVSDYITNRYYSWGVSATPYRSKGDDLWMEGVLGPISKVIPESDLVENKIIQRPNYAFYEFQHPKYEGSKDKRILSNQGHRVISYLTPNGKPHREEIYNQGIVDNYHRNELLIDCLGYYIQHPNRQGVGLILFQLYDQGRLLYKIAQEKGIEVAYADGKTKEKERLNLIQGMRSGEIPCLIASRILNEGEDIPNLEFCAIGGGGSNSRILTQQVGRVIRNKANAIVLDVYDLEKWYLERNSHDREKYITKVYPNCVTRIKDFENYRNFIDAELQS